MKRLYLILLVCLLRPSLISCIKESDLCHKTIVMHNNSDQDVCITSSLGYPDTTISSVDFVKRSYLGAKTLANTSNDWTFYSSPHGNCWEAKMRQGDLLRDTIIVFILDAGVIGDLDDPVFSPEWRDEMLLQRYDLSLSDLRKLDFQLQYPATEAMREMKMYPPFDH